MSSVARRRIILNQYQLLFLEKRFSLPPLNNKISCHCYSSLPQSQVSASEILVELIPFYLPTFLLISSDQIFLPFPNIFPFFAIFILKEDTSRF